MIPKEEIELALALHGLRFNNATAFELNNRDAVSFLYLSDDAKHFVVLVETNGMLYFIEQWTSKEMKCILPQLERLAIRVFGLDDNPTYRIRNKMPNIPDLIVLELTLHGMEHVFSFNRDRYTVHRFALLSEHGTQVRLVEMDSKFFIDDTRSDIKGVLPWMNRWEQEMEATDTIP